MWKKRDTYYCIKYNGSDCNISGEMSVVFYKKNGFIYLNRLNESDSSEKVTNINIAWEDIYFFGDDLLIFKSSEGYDYLSKNDNQWLYMGSYSTSENPKYPNLCGKGNVSLSGGNIIVSQNGHNKKLCEAREIKLFAGEYVYYINGQGEFCKRSVLKNKEEKISDNNMDIKLVWE